MTHVFDDALLQHEPTRTVDAKAGNVGQLARIPALFSTQRVKQKESRLESSSQFAHARPTHELDSAKEANQILVPAR